MAPPARSSSPGKPFQPRRLSAQAALRNRIAAARPTIGRARLGSVDVEIRAAPLLPWTRGDEVTIEGRALGRAWRAQVDRPGLAALASLIEPALAPVEGARQKDEALAAATATAIAEATLDADTLRAFDVVGPAASTSPPLAAQFGLVLAASGATCPVRIEADDEIVAALAGLAERAPPAQGAKPPVSARVTIDVAAYRLTVGDLMSLEPGDVIVPPAQFGREQCVVVVGHRLRLSGEFVDDGVRVVSLCNGTAMPKTPEAPIPPKFDTSDVDIELVFQAGRSKLSLSELARLAPGYVVSIPGVAPGAVDILVGDRCIGRAEIVDVDGAVGFSITEIRQGRGE